MIIFCGRVGERTLGQLKVVVFNEVLLTLFLVLCEGFHNGCSALSIYCLSPGQVEH